MGGRPNRGYSQVGQERSHPLLGPAGIQHHRSIRSTAQASLKRGGCERGPCLDVRGKDYLAVTPMFSRFPSQGFTHSPCVCFVSVPAPFDRDLELLGLLTET